MYIHYYFINNGQVLYTFGLPLFSIEGIHEVGVVAINRRHELFVRALLNNRTILHHSDRIALIQILCHPQQQINEQQQQVTKSLHIQIR